MAHLKHHLYHLQRVTLQVMTFLDGAVSRIPYYAKNEGSIPDLLRDIEALINKMEHERAIERIEQFIDQVKFDQAESHIPPFDAVSLIETATRLLEQIHEQMNREAGDSPSQTTS